MGNADNNPKSIDISKIKNWPQVVAASVSGVSIIVSYIIKPETAVYITVIALAVIGLACFIVYWTTPSRPTQLDAAMALGSAKGLRKYRDGLASRRDQTNDPQDCDCFEKILTELGIALDAYEP